MTFRIRNNREGRLLAGLVIVGIAAYAYPAPEDLDSDRIRHLSDVEFEVWMRGACERLRAHDAAGEVVLDEGMDDAWRVYVKMPVRMVGDRGRGATACPPNALSTGSGDDGLARRAGPGPAQRRPAGTTIGRLTERFRVARKDLASERAYSQLAQITRDRDAPGADT